MGLIVVASVLLGFALPTHSMMLAVAGGVVMAVGVIMAITFRIMDDAY